MPRPSSIQLQHFVPELGRAFGQSLALVDHAPRLARSCPKPPGRSEAERRTSMQRTRSGLTKTGSHTSTSTSPRRTTRGERAASVEQLRLALRRQSLHNCRKQSVSIYKRHSRLSLPCSFALQGQKRHWAFLKNTQNPDWTARIVRTATNA